jgi:asparagine synthase (glutamine-hydrolysing)
MCDHLIPRGPDDGGILAVGDGRNGSVLGARRLAVIDPTPHGHQPFVDEERGTVVVFNGMIYNHRELRRELEGLGESFSSDCDTEVVLRLYGRFGPACLERLSGMFAFAIWDPGDSSLFLARDRLGIKPLYYSVVDGRLVFASQVKTLLASGVMPASLSPAGVESFLRFGAVSDPATIIEGVSALEAGHCGTWRDGKLALQRYWTPDRTDDSREYDPAELRELMEACIASHTISDVPIGVFLSGGLDSSLLAALAAQARELKAVSVRFAEDAYSEAEFQEMVVDRIGCEAITVTLDARQLMGQSAAVFAAMDQPTFDGFNTYVVSRAAREAGLKVALSGLGADELFDGYDYARRVRQLEAARSLPTPVRRAVARGLDLTGDTSRVRKTQAWLRDELPSGSSYELLRSLFLPSELRRLMPAAASSPTPSRVDPAGDLWRQVCTLDLENYTRNVLLRDTDAMSMSLGLEVRVPYLADPLIAWALDIDGKRRAGGGKGGLVAAMHGYVPDGVAKRAKQGFLLPTGSWMRNELAAEVESALASPPAQLRCLLDPTAIRMVWASFRDGREHWLRPWSLYVLCRWVAESLPQRAE